jgi:hypothetical protein
MANLGTVQKNGSVGFTSQDINECRAFLRAAGLECHATGWAGNGRCGLIDFHNGGWYCCHWLA